MIKSPLFLDGWIEFNRIKWEVQPLRVHYSPDGAALPRVEAVLYLNRAGKIVEPKLNAYLPVAFEPTPTPSMPRIYQQWLTVAEYLVCEMRERGMHNMVTLPFEITDMRPWQWAGFRIDVRYTFYLEFPFDLQCIDKATRNKIRKAERAGYTCRRTTDMRHVLACLRETEERQHFDHGITCKDLEMARQLLGDEHLRAYVCYAPDGEPACTDVDLHCPGGRAVGWIGGTHRRHLQSGATQLMIKHELEDLQTAGAIGIDFAGANIPSVAAAKRSWGGRLMPFYGIESYTVRSMAKWVRAWLHAVRNGGKLVCCAYYGLQSLFQNIETVMPHASAGLGL